MGRQLLKEMQTGFAGGLNLDPDPSVLTTNEVRSSENFRINAQGTAIKRGGTQRMHATALSDGIQGGFGWMKPGGAKHVVVANGKVNLTDVQAAPWTFTELAGTISTSAVVDMTAFRDGSGECVYIADGGPLNKCTTTTLTGNISNTPNVTSLAVYNQRLWGCDGATQTLYASAINNGDYLGVVANAGLVTIIRTFADQEIFAVRSLRSSLGIFHRSGVSRLTGITIDDIDVQDSTQGFSDQVGTISKKSLIQVDDAVYFLAEQGFYRLTEGSLDLISPKLRAMVETIDPSDLPNVHGAHDKLRNEVRWYIPGKGIYVFNYVSGTWSGPWTGTYTSKIVTAMWSTEAEDDTPSQVFVGCDDGFVRLCDANNATDDVLSDGTGGSRVSGSVSLHRMFFGDETVEKSLRWVYVHADFKGGVNAYVRWRTKYNIGTANFDIVPTASAAAIWGHFTWGHFTWGTSSRADTFTAQGDGRGYYYDFTLYDDGPGLTQLSRVRAEAFDMTRR